MESLEYLPLNLSGNFNVSTAVFGVLSTKPVLSHTHTQMLVLGKFRKQYQRESYMHFLSNLLGTFNILIWDTSPYQRESYVLSVKPVSPNI